MTGQQEQQGTDRRQTESAILVKLTELSTKLDILIDDFKTHKIDDDRHFSQIYASNREVAANLANVPQKMNSCANELKQKVLDETDRRYASATGLEVFKTEVKATVRSSIFIAGAFCSAIAVVASWTVKVWGVQ